MPVADTDLLFALNPIDPKHEEALRSVKTIEGIVAPDTALLEFQFVLRGRGKSRDEIKYALLALLEILRRYGIREVKTIDLKLLALQLELEERYGLTYFDSLIAASALIQDGAIISDDKAFDKIEGLRRIPISK